ncbi:MAG: sigma-70 family RNA polymerase sigma factor [Myxococcota bacterium]
MKSRAQSLASHVAAPTDAVDVRARVQWLYRRHRDEVYRLALRYGRGDPAWAEDVTQDVFVSLCRKIESLEDWEDLSRWFYRVTHNCCLSRMRKAAVADARMLRWITGRGLQVDDGAAPLHRVGLHEVFAVVDALAPKQRIAFCMYHLDGLEQAEIGEILGLSKSYVCKLIKRACAAVTAAGWEMSDG